MRTLFVPTFRKSMHSRLRRLSRTSMLVMLISCMLVCISCSRKDFSCRQMQANVVASVDYNEDTLSEPTYALSMFVDIGTDFTAEDMQFAVSSPDGTFRWEFSPIEIEYDNIRWLGHPCLALGAGIVLPQGDWRLQILNKDGRTIDQTFSVAYSTIVLSQYPIFDDTTKDDGERYGRVWLNGNRGSWNGSLLDIVKDIHGTLMSGNSPSSLVDEIGVSEDAESVSEAEQPVPGEWVIELFSESGSSLYRQEVRLNQEYPLRQLGGTSIWDAADYLRLYRYSPETRMTIVTTQNLV